MIIGICGKMHSGKDTLGQMIQQIDPEFKIKKFATNVKKIASLMTGFSEDSFESQEFKNSYLGEEWVCKGQPITVRHFLQTMAQTVRNNFNENAWINATFSDYKPSDKWVITDVRFLNEVVAIKKKSGILVKITRETHDKSNHVSERALDYYNGFNFEIDNNSSLDDLKKHAIKIYNLYESTKY